MRELILKMHISVDAFVGGSDAGAQWMSDHDPEAMAWTAETIWNASLHIMGSNTFREMAAYWPTSTEVFAPPMNEIPKAVFSRAGRAVLKTMNANAPPEPTRAKAGQVLALRRDAESWAEAYVASGDLAEEIARLKAGEGKPIIAHGGAGFARSLVAQGLVDEFALLVHPVAMGKGLPIFSDITAPRPLKLVSSKAFPKGTLAQIYRPA
jgi:dihydrofolate reductase